MALALAVLGMGGGGLTLTRVDEDKSEQPMPERPVALPEQGRKPVYNKSRERGRRLRQAALTQE